MLKVILVVALLGAANAAATGRTCSGTDPLFLANPADCSSYFICAGGVYVLQNCAGGLVWDSSISTCNFVSAVRNGCSSEPEVPEGPGADTTTRATTTTTTTTTAKPGVPEETTTKGTTTTTKAPVPPPSGGDLSCPNSEGYTYYGLSGCSQFYLCSKGTPSGPFNCGAGLSFSQSSQSCVRPEKSECKA